MTRRSNDFLNLLLYCFDAKVGLRTFVRADVAPNKRVVFTWWKVLANFTYLTYKYLHVPAIQGHAQGVFFSVDTGKNGC